MIPARDAAATITDAVATAKRESDDVLVVDDGSRDDTAALAEAAGARVLRRPRLGLVAALNAGLAEVEGYVARMDADDRVVPGRLAEQVPLLDADPTLAVVDGQVRFFRDEGDVPAGMRRYERWVNGVVTPEDFDRLLLVESPVVHPAATLRVDAVRGVGGYRDGPFPEDYDLWLRLHAAGWRFRKVPRVLVEMRDRPRRLTRTDPRYRVDGFRRVKQAWLANGPLARPSRVWLWAQRKESRAWLRWLIAEGHTVPALVDIDPAKIGGTRRGIPVISPEGLKGVDADVGLVAVGSVGGRVACRAAITEHRPQCVEGRDWWAVR